MCIRDRITGANGYVGNWPGVTVEKKEAPLSRDKGVLITDLPGIYSLSPYSPEAVSYTHLRGWPRGMGRGSRAVTEFVPSSGCEPVKTT